MEIIYPAIPEIDGDVPIMERALTGLYKLDLALAHEDEIGMPIRTGIELYGKPETGKSSMAYYLSGRVKKDGYVTIVDFETSGRSDYVVSAVGQAGFSGKIRWVPRKVGDKRQTDEDMLDAGAKSLLPEYDDANAVILDSAAMVAPIAETEGKLSDANMGQRAKLLAKWTRMWVPYLNMVEEPKLVLIVNHMLAQMGSQYDPTNIDWGFSTPGGYTIKFGCAARLRMNRKETFDDGTFEVEIRVDKLRYGGQSKVKRGRAMIVPGVGVSPALTAAFDCMDLGYARRKNYVQVLDEKDGKEWKNVSRLSDLIRYVREGRVEKFEPFYERIGWEE